VIEQFQTVLQAKLQEVCPVDTGNMSTNIYLYDYGTYYSIKIQTFYAQWVNENKRRGPKEIANYHWVQRVIKEVAVMFGATVELEVY
jgi:hypothetical protein